MKPLSHKQTQFLRWIARHNMAVPRIRAANQITFGSLARRGLVVRRGALVELTSQGAELLQEYNTTNFIQRVRAAEPSESVALALRLGRMRMELRDRR